MAPESFGQPDTSAASPAVSAYALVLFVSAGSASSARAIRQVQTLCDHHLPGRHSLTVVDVNRHPELVPGRVLATPTLLRQSPEPERLAVGDFADDHRVLTALEIPVAPSSDEGVGLPVHSPGRPDG